MTRRPGRFRLGMMTDRIDIQEATETLDSFGQVTRSWSDLIADLPAHVQTTSGGETIRGKQVIQGVTKAITIRTPATAINSKHRVVFGSETYGIVLVTPIDGDSRSRYQLIQAKVTDD